MDGVIRIPLSALDGADQGGFDRGFRRYDWRTDAKCRIAVAHELLPCQVGFVLVWSASFRSHARWNSELLVLSFELTSLSVILAFAGSSPAIWNRPTAPAGPSWARGGFVSYDVQEI